MTYKYALVLFVNDSSSKEIDIIPSSWLDHYKEYGGTGCKYMPESLLKNSKYCKLLQTMVKYCDEPDPTWPTFHVEIRGVAKTMEEAEKKLLRLEKEPYAFSTDNEQSAKAKAAAVEKTFKLKSSSKDKSKLDNIFSQAASELANEPTEIPDFLLERMKENYNSLSKQFANLKGQIQNISADVTQILSEIKKNNSTLLLDSSQTDPEGEGNHVVRKLEFPLSTIEEFDKFNEKSKDEKYKSKINKRLYFSLDGKITITRNMGNIIRAYISRDVALSFVAVKSTSNKKVFKDTTFLTCIKNKSKDSSVETNHKRVMVNILGANVNVGFIIPSLNYKVDQAEC
ncbi:hypothetical protein G9C98_000164 [Cotesia typhae]|uniref:Uncharacterized protein n=1 Tax=Cotesia typhae TaxID=2053667 RepID=A0A8J5R9Y3_9HYME|nr:hypothetical protein G9C98_000164 [Cotesia typhae]